LLSAANSGKQDVVEWLVDRHGASLEDRNTNGDSALLLAAFGGHCSFLLWLLERGCDFDDENNDGLSPLLSACNGGHREMVELLLDCGCSLDVATSSGYTPLILAACGGHLELIKWLVDVGCPLDARTKEGDTALLLACYCGHVDIVRWMLSAGSSVTERNDTGFTPLISAANGGKLEVVEALLSIGSDIEEEDDDGYTPLLLAARRGFLSVTQYLVMRGANTHATIRGTDEDIFDLTQQCPAVHDWLQSVRYFPALHVAAAVGSTERVRRLLAMGEDPSERAVTNGPSLVLGPRVSALDVARAHSREAGPTPQLVHTLRLASSLWTPSTHMLFGPSYRSTVRQVVLVWHRVATGRSSFALPPLPPELWYRIAAMLPRTERARALTWSPVASLTGEDADSGCDHDDMAIEDLDDDLEWNWEGMGT